MPEQAKDAMTEPKRDEALTLADKLLDDLLGRKGVGNELEAVKHDDDETWQEIRETLASLIRPILQAQKSEVANEDVEAKAQELESFECCKNDSSYCGQVEDAKEAAALLRSQAREISDLLGALENIKGYSSTVSDRLDPIATAYNDGYNEAIKQVTEQVINRFLKD